MAAMTALMTVTVLTICFPGTAFGNPLDPALTCGEDTQLGKVCSFCAYVYPMVEALREQCCRGLSGLQAWCRNIYVEPKGMERHIMV